MAKKTLLIFSILVSISVNGQNTFFRTYADSLKLVSDANSIVDDFAEKINAISPVFTPKPEAILNTKPFLIFYSPKSNKVNLPIWQQVIPEQKDFFYSLAGDKKSGEEMFGLFFNGFYLPHELGHALRKVMGKTENDLYRNEYFANIVAILYWRKLERTQELLQCYRYAKKW